MEMRIGTQADIPKIRNYLKEMWLMHVNEKPEYLNRDIIEQSDLSEYFEKCFDESESAYVLIMEEDGELVGFTKVNIEKIQKFFNETTVAYIDDIYVLKAFRKRGFAKRLLKAVESFARERGIHWLKCRVYSFNRTAQELFTQSGFEPLYSELFKIL